MQRYFRFLAVTVVVVAVWGCGEKSGESNAKTDSVPVLTASTLGTQTVLTASEYLSAPPYSSANPSNGAKLAQICRACHSFNKGGPNMIGPALYGFFGSEAGAREGFEYSSVLANADFIWTPRALDAWLAQPGRFLPGNRMTFAGIVQRDERDDLIAYLLNVTTAEDGN